MTTLTLGAWRIDRVVESEGPFAPASFILPHFDAQRVDAQAAATEQEAARAHDRAAEHKLRHPRHARRASATRQSPPAVNNESPSRHAVQTAPSRLVGERRATLL